MTLKFYNTLTRQKETFEPLDWSNKAIAESDKKVRLYVCGPTVYDDAHIGNARPILVFDVLTRLLRHHYGPDHVTYVRNITDVDDKINARAHQEKIDIRQLTEQTARQFHEDIEALGALKPDVEPRATDHIPQMIDMINRLVLKNYAYEAKGHILFHVPSMKDYGSFSGRSTDEMVAGARVEVAPYKKNPMDFVLWKPSGGDEPGWESPWGRGRPGWHIECSAMSKHYLGEQFDIHGGGIDLLFPHHENEIAQSRCAHGSPMMAKLWMHNGYLQIEGEKMSKSSGNFITIRNLLRKWPGEAIRLAMLSTHYRQPINWTEKNLSEAKKNLDHWIQLTAESDPSPILCADFHAALKDDLNTPQAITVLHELRREARRSRAAAACLKSCAGLIGLLQKGTKEWAAWRPASLTINESQIEALIEDRLKARDEKNWAEADQIRDRLTTMGITLKDGPEGTCWKVIE